MAAVTIPGYDFGSPALPRSPVSLTDLELLQRTLLWSEEDDRYLRMAAEVLDDQVDQVLDLWYDYVASHQHLVRYFAGPDGQPIGSYLERVRARFAQWVRDVCTRPRDQAWLDYQHEIALRHTSAKKNQTDGADAPSEVPLRYMVAFIFPITATMRRFLAAKGHRQADVDGMHTAWFKAVVLHVCLWCQPYAAERW
ncbi:MAG TPA: protoglobin domain-containing protein [Candidatus Dormibacteraeota bacterium]|nr:protoglobin domain-containing protein [Candidatus Dormibacteraeota bacterium]